MGLCFVITRRFLKLDGGGNTPVHPTDEQMAFRHQDDAAEIAAEHGTCRRPEPAEAAAVENRGFGGIAEILEILVGNFFQRLDSGFDFGHQLSFPSQRRK